MTMIAPSILSADFANLEREIGTITDSGADWVHVDVMDGLFVPNISIGIPVLKSLREVTKLPLDVHLMIDRPIRYIDRFAEAGADRMTVHLESDTPEQIEAALDRIHELGCKTGLSIKPATPADAIIPFLPKCDLVLVMTVEPGFGGQKLIPETLAKIRRARELTDAQYPDCLIQVDGGVDEKTVGRLKEHGAQVFVTGKAFFRRADRDVFVRQLRDL